MEIPKTDNDLLDIIILTRQDIRVGRTDHVLTNLCLNDFKLTQQEIAHASLIIYKDGEDSLTFKDRFCGVNECFDFPKNKL